MKSEMEPAVRILRVNEILTLRHPMVACPFLRSHRFTAERHLVRFQNLAVTHQRHGSRRLLDDDAVHFPRWLIAPSERAEQQEKQCQMGRTRFPDAAHSSSLRRTVREI